MIKKGNYRETNVGREDEWMSLINGARLQHNCKKEGFNVQCSWSGRKARIGILGNNEIRCDSCNSVIGFGIKITWKKGSSGNIYYTDNKDININRSIKLTKLKLKTFGYIFVQ